MDAMLESLPATLVTPSLRSCLITLISGAIDEDCDFCLDFPSPKKSSLEMLVLPWNLFSLFWFGSDLKFYNIFIWSLNRYFHCINEHKLYLRCTISKILLTRDRFSVCESFGSIAIWCRWWRSVIRAVVLCSWPLIKWHL